MPLNNYKEDIVKKGMRSSDIVAKSDINSETTNEIASSTNNDWVSDFTPVEPIKKGS